MNALAQLDQAVNFGLEELSNLRISGAVTEVTPSYYRLVGLSHFIKLGECVGINHNGATQLAEVVRIDAEASTVKTFEAQIAAGLGDQAFRIAPCMSRQMSAGRDASSMRSDGRSTPKGLCAAANMLCRSKRHLQRPCAARGSRRR